MRIVAVSCMLVYALLSLPMLLVVTTGLRLLQASTRFWYPTARVSIFGDTAKIWLQQRLGQADLAPARYPRNLAKKFLPRRQSLTR